MPSQSMPTAGASLATATSERRSAPRYAPNPETSCRVGSTASRMLQPAAITNISTSGIRMRVAQPYEAGTPLIIELSGRDGQFQRILMVRVIQADPTADGGYLAGCAFASPLEGHELLALVL